MNEELTRELERLFGRNREAAFIVEGAKDKKAVESFGVQKVYVLNKKPLFELAENIREKEAVILTDLDAEGKKLYGKLRTQLNRLGVKTDDSIRNFLYKNTRIRQIEGLNLR